MRGKRLGIMVWSSLWVLAITAWAFGQGALVVEFPDPALFYQNTTFAVDGDVGYVPSFNRNMLWSFSMLSGRLLDEDGLVLPGSHASDSFMFSNKRLAMPGWFPNQAVFVADVSDPENLKVIGVIEIGGGTNIQGQNIEIDDDGVIGYVASFPNDTLYSFNVDTLSLEDPDGLRLTGNPDRIGLAGDRIAIADTTYGRIIVADVSNPANMQLAGTIELPGASNFRSNDDIVFADDGRTGFITSQERVLYSFDVIDLAVVDPDGLTFGTQGFGEDVAIYGDTVGAIYSRGLTFVDVSDPADMQIISEARFGETVAPQGNATVEFTADGTQAAMSVVYPGHFVYTFDVQTGEQVADRFPVGEQPNFLTVYEPGERVAVICSGVDVDNIYLIHNLFGPNGDTNNDGDVDLEDFSKFQLCFTGPGGAVSPGCEPADIDEDNDVDLTDLGLFVANLTGAL